MRYLTHVAMFFALLPGVSPLAWAASPAQDPKDTGTITGRVTLDGKPAHGVIVMATLSDPSMMVERILNSTASPKAITDSDGRYRLEGLPAGTYGIAPSAPTLVSADTTRRNKEVTVAGDATVEGIDFSLRRGGVISGKITDSEGRPVIATLISLEPMANPSFSSSFRDRMYFTDDRGIYRIFGLPSGRYLVSAGDSDNSPFGQLFASKPRIRTYYPGVTEEPMAKAVEVTAGAEVLGVDIKLNVAGKGSVVSGRVIDAETRRPVANTMVVFTAQASRSVSRKADDDDDDDSDGDEPVRMGGFAMTNARGEFRLESVTPGSYQAGVNSLGEIVGGSEYYADPVSFEVRSANLDNLEIAVHRGASINGVVVVENADGPEAREQLALLLLRAQVTDDRTQSFSSGGGKVAADGSFRIGGLKAGNAKITTTSTGRPRLSLVRIERNGVEQHDGIVVQANEQITGLRVIVVQANCVIRGHVTLQGGTLPQTPAIWAVARSNGELQSDNHQSFRVDAKGNFVIEGVAQGTVVVEVVCMVNQAAGEKGIISAKQTVTVVSGIPAEVNLVLDLSAKEPDK
jgi:protocatechuate 3,4-dioxygenase beta subunit